MATRLYLRNTPVAQVGAPLGTATTDADEGHVGEQRRVCLSMSLLKGAAAVKRTWNYGVAPGRHLDLAALFISPALADQTLMAGERFTVASAIKGNAPPEQWGNHYLRAFAYLWRPGVGWVATVSATDPRTRTGVNGGRDYGSQVTWHIVTFDALGGDIQVRLRDRMVVELWSRFDHDQPISEVSDNYCHYWGGTDDTKADGEVVADPASYLEYSGELILAQEVMMNSANILVGARDLTVDGANVGALEGGVTVTYEPRHIEHTVDQRLGVQRVDRIAERMTVTANLKEATLENLRIAWGQPASSLSSAGAALSLGVGGAATVTEHTLVLTGKAPGTGRTRTITCHKAVAIETSAHSYTKEGATVYPVTFLLVEDSTREPGFKYMTIVDDQGEFEFA